MLSLIAKTAFLSFGFSWGMIFLLGSIARSSAIHGRLLPGKIVRLAFGDLQPFVISSLRSVTAWYPVPVLIGLSAVLFCEGLIDIAAVCLCAASITQLWRPEFPSHPALTSALGWDYQTVVTHRSLILPPLRRVALCIAFWTIWIGAAAFLTGHIIIGLLLGCVGGAGYLLVIKTTITNALRLERIDPEL